MIFSGCFLITAIAAAALGTASVPSIGATAVRVHLLVTRMDIYSVAYRPILAVNVCNRYCPANIDVYLIRRVTFEVYLTNFM